MGPAVKSLCSYNLNTIQTDLTARGENLKGKKWQKERLLRNAWNVSIAFKLHNFYVFK